jgi:NDP-sugar pyrophosphorylase family protein
MVRVAGRPILERLILHLMGCGLRHFYVSVNYLADVIEEYFGDGSTLGCRIDYLRESTPLGTGGPLSLLRPIPNHPVVVVNGDLVTQCNVGAMLEFHETNGFCATFGVKPYSIQIPFGVAVMEGDRLVGLQEKPIQRMLINAGIYVLSAEAIRMIPPGVEHRITDLFQRCIEVGLPVGAHLVEDDWIDVGRFEELRRARGES